MKRILVLFICLELVWCTNVFSEESLKSYSESTKFIMSALYAASKYSDFIESYPKTNTVQDNIETLMAQNRHLKEGVNILQEYVNSKNETINTIATLLDRGLNKIISGNEKMISMTQESLNGKAISEGDLAIFSAQFTDNKKEAGEMISTSLGNLLNLIMKYKANKEEMRGQIDFLIPKEERIAVSDLIKQLFSERLADYAKFNLSIARKEKPDENLLTWTAAGLDNLRCIQFDTFEEEDACYGITRK